MTTSSQSFTSLNLFAPATTVSDTDVLYANQGLANDAKMTVGQLLGGTVRLSHIVGNETPQGTIDGFNTSFTLAHIPQAGSLLLLLNGVVQEPGNGNDYTITGSAITMLVVPQIGQKLRAYYVF